MKTFILLIATLVAVQALSIEDQWVQFKETNKRQYRNFAEDRYRRNIFTENLKTINEHNKKFEAGESSYKMGVNKFADLSKQEFLDRLALSKKTKPTLETHEVYKKSFKNLPKSVDWTSKNVVTPIKNQGNCGSCWSFSATGSLESQNAIQNNKLISLSEQNLVDCSTKYGNAGCDGGTMIASFDYIKDNGITTEDKYPYEATDGNKCRYNPKDSVLKVSGYVRIPSEDEDSLQDAVANIGPVSIGIDATTLQFYEGGLLDDDTCSPYNLNHGVLAVGYGSVGQKDYWLVKNSWGEDWGENGYVRMSRNNKNQCGVASDACYPTL